MHTRSPFNDLTICEIIKILKIKPEREQHQQEISPASRATKNILAAQTYPGAVKDKLKKGKSYRSSLFGSEAKNRTVMVFVTLHTVRVKSQSHREQKYLPIA